MQITSKLFGTVGKESIHLYTLSNGVMDIDIMNYGAAITCINVPGRDGGKQNVVAGFSKLEPYIDDDLYLGCIIGRFANRIRNGRFTINGTKFQLSLNDGKNHLHGGANGFNKQVWTLAGTINETLQKGIILNYNSSDGEEGYPGNLQVFVSYILRMNNELIIQYRATTNKPTIVSLTNHSYFNLSGFSSCSVHEHLLSVQSDRYLVTNDNLATGDIDFVENNGLLDFRTSKMLSKCLGELIHDKGLNHCFLLADDGGLEKTQITLSDKASGRTMQVKTNQPAVQIYSANYWDGSHTNEAGVVFGQHGAVAIETQSYTDAPNHKEFKGSFLYPGQVYDKTTIFKFVTDCN